MKSVAMVSILISLIVFAGSEIFPTTLSRGEEIGARRPVTGTIEKPLSILQDDPGKAHRYDCEDDLIEVMFIYNSRVRLRKGRLVDEGGDALAGLENILKDLPGSTWQRLCDVPEEVLDEWQINGEARTGRPVYNLNNIYRLRIEEGEDVWEVCRQLETLKGVHLARPVPKPVPRPFLPPDYQSNQGYLDPASSTPTGINAEYAWTRPGGTGQGVTVCDIEGEWNYSHHDLTKLVGSQLNSNCSGYYGTDHGTAVVGELVGDNNGWGVTGICYGANLKTCCDYYGAPPSWSPAGAIALAVSNLSAGDIILLEEQWDYTGSYDYIPIEWWGSYYPASQTNNAVYAAIVNAVSNGIHVVEAACNGYYNLDNLTWYGDSGAIIVGAGGAYTGGSWPAGDLERCSFSDYGSRVNVQGWGEDVYTAGYADLYSAEGENYYYTAEFAGTSSASPVVAGAAACCLGYWMNGLGQAKDSLTPSQLRTILTDTGTPQVKPWTGHIGPRPDLLAAFQYLSGLVPHGIIDSGDYDGDGTSDVAIFRRSSGLWSARGITRVYFGSENDLPVSGDYSGTGTTDIGVFRASSGLWAIKGLSRIYFGSSSDTAVPGDYDGDGCCDTGIFRGSSGLWAIRDLTRVYFGSDGDTVVPGDYDGDGTKKIAVFRPGSGLWALRNISRIYFGSESDTVAPGDYSGDGSWEVGIFRSSSGLWAVRGVTRNYFGGGSDQPVPADYNGNASDDIGIFRDTSGLWAVRGITRAYYGASGDIPVTR